MVEISSFHCFPFIICESYIYFNDHIIYCNLYTLVLYYSKV